MQICQGAILTGRHVYRNGNGVSNSIDKDVLNETASIGNNSLNKSSKQNQSENHVAKRNKELLNRSRPFTSKAQRFCKSEDPTVSGHHDYVNDSKDQLSNPRTYPDDQMNDSYDSAFYVGNTRPQTRMFDTDPNRYLIKSIKQNAQRKIDASWDTRDAVYYKIKSGLHNDSKIYDTRRITRELKELQLKRFIPKHSLDARFYALEAQRISPFKSISVDRYSKITPRKSLLLQPKRRYHDSLDDVIPTRRRKRRKDMYSKTFVHKVDSTGNKYEMDKTYGQGKNPKTLEKSQGHSSNEFGSEYDENKLNLHDSELSSLMLSRKYNSKTYVNRHSPVPLDNKHSKRTSVGEQPSKLHSDEHVVKPTVSQYSSMTSVHKQNPYTSDTEQDIELRGGHKGISERHAHEYNKRTHYNQDLSRAHEGGYSTRQFESGRYLDSDFEERKTYRSSVTENNTNVNENKHKSSLSKHSPNRYESEQSSKSYSDKHITKTYETTRNLKTHDNDQKLKTLTREISPLAYKHKQTTKHYRKRNNPNTHINEHESKPYIDERNVSTKANVLSSNDHGSTKTHTNKHNTKTFIKDRSVNPRESEHESKPYTNEHVHKSNGDLYFSHRDNQRYEADRREQKTSKTKHSVRGNGTDKFEESYNHKNGIRRKYDNDNFKESYGHQNGSRRKYDHENIKESYRHENGSRRKYDNDNFKESYGHENGSRRKYDNDNFKESYRHENGSRRKYDNDNFKESYRHENGSRDKYERNDKGQLVTEWTNNERKHSRPFISLGGGGIKDTSQVEYDEPGENTVKHSEPNIRQKSAIKESYGKRSKVESSNAFGYATKSQNSITGYDEPAPKYSPSPYAPQQTYHDYRNNSYVHPYTNAANHTLPTQTLNDANGASNVYNSEYKSPTTNYQHDTSRPLQRDSNVKAQVPSSFTPENVVLSDFEDEKYETTKKQQPRFKKEKGKSLASQIVESRKRMLNQETIPPVKRYSLEFILFLSF